MTIMSIYNRAGAAGAGCCAGVAAVGAGAAVTVAACCAGAAAGCCAGADAVDKVKTCPTVMKLRF